MANTDQITIVCFLHARPAMKDRVREELTQLAAQTRNEAGNINYLLHQATDDANLFIIYENWKDQAALDFHMRQPYLQAFLKRTDALLERPVDGTICTLL